MFNYVKILNNHQPPFYILTFMQARNALIIRHTQILNQSLNIFFGANLFCDQHDFCCSVERLFLLACVLTLVTINLYTRAVVGNIATGEIENETVHNSKQHWRVGNWVGGGFNGYCFS